MGREIRRVPFGWEHPTRCSIYHGDYHDNSCGNYQPMHDQDYESAAEAWISGFTRFMAGDKGGAVTSAVYFWEYEGPPPEEEHYRPKITEEPICYQIYETVSEGTPVSPVFETLGDLEAWLVKEGYSPEAAGAFAKDGWAFSMVLSGGKLYNDIESAAIE